MYKDDAHGVTYDSEQLEQKNRYFKKINNLHENHDING